MKSCIQKIILILFLLGLVMPLKAQWTQMNNGLYGGLINSLAVIGTNLFAGTRGGVFMSTNNGTSWTHTTDFQTGSYDDIYLLAIGSNLFATTPDGVYLSTDNGSIWTLKTTPHTFNFTSLATDGTTLIAGTYGDGLLRSTNNGESWTVINSGITDKYILSIGFAGSVWFAADFQGGLYKSTNQGTNWTALTADLPGTWITSYASIGSNIFITTESGVLVSSNAGTNWSPVNNGLESFPNNVVANGTTLFAAINNDLYTSINNGADWTSMNLGVGVGPLAFIGTNLFAGSVFPGRGIFLTQDNGLSWSAVNTGLTSTFVRSLLSYGNNLIAGVEGKGIYFSGNNGASWVQENSGLTIGTNYSINALDTIGTDIFMGSPDGVPTSTNGGASWTEANFFPMNKMVTCLAHIGTNLFAGTWDGGVYLSNNKGTSWTEVNTGLTNPYITSLVVIGNNLFASTRSGVFITTNSGTNWTEVSTGLTEKYVYALGAIGTKLFATTQTSVFASTDNGASWADTNYTFPQFSSLTTTGSIILLLSDGWMYASSDDGVTWVEIDKGGLPNGYQFSHWTVHGTNVFLGTVFNGVWSRPLSDFETILGTSEVSSSKSISLYPNPSSNIIFIKGTREPVTSSYLIDMVGNSSPIKLVQQDNLLSADIKYLASGVYILKMSEGAKVYQIKFIKQ